MPTRTRIAVALAPLAAAAVLVGCGSSGPSKADFAKKADAICTEVNKAHPNPGLFRTAKDAEVGTAREIQIRTDLDRRLKALDVPDSEKSDFAKYNAETQKLIGWLKLENAAAKAKDQKKFGQYTQAFQKAAEFRDALAGKLGFKVCGRKLPAKKQ